MSDASLVRYYTFDEDQRLSDTSKSSPPGYLVVPSSKPSYISNCQWACAECCVLGSDAKGSDGGQYFSVPTVNLGKMSSEHGFSICVWFMFDSVRAWTRIFDFGEGAASGRLFLARNEGLSTLRLDFKSRIDGDVLLSSNPVGQGTWRHMCVSNQGREWTIYENGIRSESVFASFDLDSIDLTSNFLGRSNWDDDLLLQGKLDEFRLYKKALSWNEVAEIYAYRGNVSSANSCKSSKSVRTSSSGTISDGPTCYASLSDCQWIIAPPGAASVTLSFVSLSTEQDYDTVRVFSCATVSCLRPYDLLELSDSPFSGSNVPGPITSSTGVMMVRFTSDSSVENSGFTVSYTSTTLSCIEGMYLDISNSSENPIRSLPSVVFGDSALFAYYTFGTDSRLKDSSHASADLAPSSRVAPTYVSDCRWPGAECSQLSSEADSSGDGQFFTLPPVNLGAMSAKAGFSICTWFVFDTVRSASRIFDMGNGEYSNNVFLARNGESGTLYTEYWANNVDSSTLESPNAIREGIWRHVCIVNKGRKWMFYDDGELTTLDTARFDLVDVELASNFIGRSNWNGDLLLQGKIDEFRMYCKALEMTEIAEIFLYKGTRSFPISHFLKVELF